MDRINTWWEETRGERFWLGVTSRAGTGGVLATPCRLNGNSRSSKHALISHVKDGDVVFHFDEEQQAIVAWSTSRGRVKQIPLVWSRRAMSPDDPTFSRRLLPSLAIGLGKTTPLDSVLTLDQIARIHWDLFPALRAFEDMVGEPLYYPFAMMGRSHTRLLDGYVFKLPTLFVECFPALAQVAERMRWSAPTSVRHTG